MSVHSETRQLLWVDIPSVSAFDRRSDDLDCDKPAEALSTGEPAKVARHDVPAETRNRGETYADTRQALESGWESKRRFDSPCAELAGFSPERAGLPKTSAEDADRYLEQRGTTRPWLEVARRATPESRRILAAIDQGAGHGHIRHEGWATEEANMRRVAYLEDPAQLDASKRLRSIDGLKPNNRRHICAELATRITDPDAFATAYARGTDQFEVRAALSRPYDRDSRPEPVRVPIAELLGKNGHKHCTGWQLEPVAGSMDAAIENRYAWRTALAKERQPDVPRPAARPVPTFEGGTMLFLIGHNKEQDSYEITNMYPEPRDDGFPRAERPDTGGRPR